MTTQAVATVQRQYDAYNARDAAAFAACYAADCAVAELNGQTTLTGAEALQHRYTELFSDHPENRATLLNRIVLGGVVVDHKQVDRGPDKPSFQVVAIYTVRNSRIARVDFVKQDF